MIHSILDVLSGLTFVEILMKIGPVGYVILLILLCFSLLSWTIILYKYRALQQARSESQKFLEIYYENSDLAEVYSACAAFRTAPVVRLFKAGYLELQRIRKDMMTVKVNPKESKVSVDVIVQNWVEDFTGVLQENIVRETAILEHYLIFLAITSSTAPLLGLLGTVWGVMSAFWSVGMQGYTSLGVIAPGVSAALVTTIGGLATAIPAAVAYNYLLNQVKILSSDIECFASAFTSVIRKELRKAL